jgi:hypothetical protein
MKGQKILKMLQKRIKKIPFKERAPKKHEKKG